MSRWRSLWKMSGSLSFTILHWVYWYDPPSCLLSMLSSPSSPSLFLCVRRFSLCIIFVAVHWTHSSISTSFLPSGVQNWTQHPDGSPVLSRGKGSIDLLALQPRMLSPFAASAHSCLIINVSVRTPWSFSAKLLLISWLTDTTPQDQTGAWAKGSSTENCSCPSSIWYLSEQLICLSNSISGWCWAEGGSK